MPGAGLWIYGHTRFLRRPSSVADTSQAVLRFFILFFGRRKGISVKADYRHVFALEAQS